MRTIYFNCRLFDMNIAYIKRIKMQIFILKYMNLRNKCHRLLKSMTLNIAYKKRNEKRNRYFFVEAISVEYEYFN